MLQYYIATVVIKMSHVYTSIDQTEPTSGSGVTDPESDLKNITGTYYEHLHHQLDIYMHVYK